MGRLLLLVGSLALADGLSWPTSVRSRVRNTAGTANSALYRYYRAPAPTTSGTETRLAAVQTALEARASPPPHLSSAVRRLCTKARSLAGYAVADLAELHSWRRMGSTIFVAVLVVAWREGLRRGMSTNPFQVMLMGVCVLLEVLHLATPDGSPTR